jgi:hypothetical protein
LQICARKQKITNANKFSKFIAGNSVFGGEREIMVVWLAGGSEGVKSRACA